MMVRIGSMFSGVGGLDRAVHALWPDAEIAWFCEHDDNASAVLAARFPGIPNHGDVQATDWTTVEPVDVVCGGFPCQDISQAGKRAGIKEGTRSGLWFDMLRAVRDLRPGLLLLENVAAITSSGGGLDVVLGSLAEVGWDAEWACLRASDVGAPHGRDRWFAVCWPAGDPDSLAWAQALARQGRRETVAQPEPVERAVGPDGGAQGDVSLLPTPRTAARSSRKAMVENRQWSAPSLEQAVELAQGILPREFRTWDEVPGRSGRTLLPTPAVNDMGRAYTPEEWDAWTERMKAEHGNGNGHGKSLEIEAQRLLPTPRSTDGPKGGPGQVSGRGKPDSLPAIGALLPTPTSRDWKDGRPNENVPTNAMLGREVWQLLPTPRATRGGSSTETANLLPTPTVTQGRNATSGRQPHAEFNSGTTLQDVAYASRWGEYGEAVARWEAILGCAAPAPTDGEGRLSPEFVEWMMGWPEGWTYVPETSRSQRLKRCGNGVVSLQAFVAYSQLLDRILEALEEAA